MSMRRRHLLAALVGIVAALVTLAVAEVVALFVSPAASPLAAVGSFVIDIVPPWVKDTAIALFGTNDKAALLILLGLLVAILAALVGVLELRRPPLGVVGLAVVGLIATVAAGTRAEATIFWALPTVIGMVLGVVVLRVGMRRLTQWIEVPATASTSAALSRRGFVGFVGASAGAALVAGLAARAVNATSSAVNTVREALTLPRPATAAAPIPAGAELDIEGLYPLVTPNPDFYRIDTAIVVPVVRAADWRLRIIGEVENEVEITFDELLALPLIETYVTLTCVSNEVGGGLIGNAKWMGYPIRELLARAKPKAGADMVMSRSVDGFTAGTPLSVLMEEDRDSILAVSMNGEALPLEHGFPVRMVVPGLYGYVSATKWVTELKLTRFSAETAYWTDRGWSAKGPIKLSSRIDTPKYTSIVTVGEQLAVAGVAWSQHTGVSAVEIRVDKGDWMPAALAPAISDDTWVQWSTTWTPTEAKVYLIEVRATDANGEVQSSDRVQPAPNGSEGWHAITIEARD
jgi:DMSO/TMAO reductase YedYZ molybdopterin-dependent catalytic subunit